MCLIQKFHFKLVLHRQSCCWLTPTGCKSASTGKLLLLDNKLPVLPSPASSSCIYKSQCYACQSGSGTENEANLLCRKGSFPGRQSQRHSCCFSQQQSCLSQSSSGVLSGKAKRASSHHVNLCKQLCARSVVFGQSPVVLCIIMQRKHQDLHIGVFVSANSLVFLEQFCLQAQPQE